MVEDIITNDSIENIAEEKKINAQIIIDSEFEVLLLPSTSKIHDDQTEILIFAGTTKEIMIVLQEGGLNAELYDDDKEKSTLVLNAADIIIPTLIFLGGAATTVGLNILSNWLYENYVKKDMIQKPSIEIEYIRMEKPNKIIEKRKIIGPVDEVHKIISSQSTFSKKKEIDQEKPDTIPSWDQRRMESAKESVNFAQDLIKKAELKLKSNNKDAEKNYRKSLEKLREAYLWHPDLKYRIHLHDVGRKVHDIFGCKLKFDDGRYHVSCPVMLSHNKGGVSIGGYAKMICSICEKDTLVCPHVKGRLYDNVIAKDSHGTCNICANSKCAHIEGKTYDKVEAFAIVTELIPDHVAFVEKPAIPLAVINQYSLSKSDIVNMLPKSDLKSFEYGKTTIRCSHCLVCKGD